MSHQEYIDKLDEDQLRHIISLATIKLDSLVKIKKERFWVVSDGFINFGFFEYDQRARAAEFLSERFVIGGDEIEISLEWWRREDIKEMIK